VQGGELRETLKTLVVRRCVFVGVGNESRGDDGFGPVCARLLRQGGVEAIDAGEVPENYTSVIAGARPEAVIFIDAADFGGEAGEIGLFPAASACLKDYGTHAGSLAILARFLEERCECPVHILCAQTTGASEHMDRRLRRAAENLSELVVKLAQGDLPDGR